MVANYLPREDTKDRLLILPPLILRMLPLSRPFPSVITNQRHMGFRQACRRHMQIPVTPTIIPVTTSLTIMQPSNMLTRSSHSSTGQMYLHPTSLRCVFFSYWESISFNAINEQPSVPSWNTSTSQSAGYTSGYNGVIAQPNSNYRTPLESQDTVRNPDSLQSSFGRYPEQHYPSTQFKHHPTSSYQPPLGQ